MAEATAVTEVVPENMRTHIILLAAQGKVQLHGHGVLVQEHYMLVAEVAAH